MSKRRTNNRKLFKTGYLWFLIPVFSILLFLLILMIIAGTIVGVIWILTPIFIGLTLYLRWVIYFEGAYFKTFFIIEGTRKIPYNRLEKVLHIRKFAGGAPNIISIYFRTESGKLRYAKFETGYAYYMAEVLNFLDDKVEQGVIKEKTFKEIGVERINGKFETTRGQM